MQREYLENAVINAYCYCVERAPIIDKYLNNKGIDDETEISECLTQLSDNEIKELFKTTFN